MRLPHLTLVLVLAAMPALAQPTPPPPEDLPPPGAVAPPPPQSPPPESMQGPPPMQGQRPRMTGRQRFEAANVTNDGKLTREQAQAAHWMPVARHFDEIDHDRKGYITLQDLRDWAAARQGAAPPPSPPQ